MDLYLENYLKGPKLTKISPNKTISGSIRINFFSTIVLSILFYYLINNFNLIIIVGLLTSVSCQLGDLFFSYLKRKAKLKIREKFFPGHGGVLDRLDGILLGIPTAF